MIKVIHLKKILLTIPIVMYLIIVLCGCNEKVNTPEFQVKPDTVIKISPVNRTQFPDLSPVFRWKKVLGAEKYIFQIDHDTFSRDSNFFEIELSDTSFQMTSELKPYKKYYWRVAAKNSAGEGEYSELWSFQTRNTSTSFIPVPELISPDKNTLDVPVRPSFRLKGVKGVISPSYNISIMDASFNSIVNFYTKDTIVSFPDWLSSLQYSTKYYWTAYAASECNRGESALPAEFITEDSPVPNLIIPSDNYSGITLPEKFGWTRTKNTVSYVLQISKDSLFSANIIFSKETNSLSENFYGNIEKNTEYYWRVCSKSSSGSINYSSVRKFTVLDEFLNGLQKMRYVYINLHARFTERCLEDSALTYYNDYNLPYAGYSYYATYGWQKNLYSFSGGYGGHTAMGSAKFWVSIDVNKKSITMLNFEDSQTYGMFYSSITDYHKINTEIENLSISEYDFNNYFIFKLKGKKAAESIRSLIVSRYKILKIESKKLNWSLISTEWDDESYVEVKFVK